MEKMIDSNQPMIYQIKVKSHLSSDWTHWFDGLTITPEEDGDTLLTGPVVDQAALYGLLKKVRDLGMPLISLNPVQRNEAIPEKGEGKKEGSQAGETFMKAIVHKKYGSPEVLELIEIEKPTPKDDEVLVQVRASSVNPAEWYDMIGLFIGRPQAGLFKPKDPRIGADFAGVVEAVGSRVTEFKPGDEVFGGRGGAFAEYVCIRAERGIAHKPTNLTFERAAAVPTAAITALQGLRDYGQIQPGQKVLINGASGGVGTFSVQIAKEFGAEVTGVCSSRNVDLIRSLGADHVIDYTREDFTKSGKQYDLLLDIAGSRSWSEYRRVLKPNGIFVLVGAKNSNPLLGPLSHVIKLRAGSFRASQKVVFFIAKFNKADMEILRELIESEKVTPFVERTYPLTETADAMRHLGTGHARGKIVITIK